MGESAEGKPERQASATSLAPASRVNPTTADSTTEAVVVVPAQFSECAPVAVGTAVWALLFAIGLFLRPDLIESGREWWIWSAAAGVFLGLFGYVYLRRRQARLRARA